MLNLSILLLRTSVVKIKCDGGTSEAGIGEGIREFENIRNILIYLLFDSNSLNT